MDKLEYSRNKLQTVKDRFAEIAFMSGISSKTLYNVMNGDHSPNTSTVDKIYSTLKALKPLKVKK